jgi:hypothetical protein
VKNFTNFACGSGGPAIIIPPDQTSLRRWTVFDLRVLSASPFFVAKKTIDGGLILERISFSHRASRLSFGNRFLTDN